jgi:dTMP kinase
MKGIFVTFEGIDASGKTTQFKKLVDYLKRKKLPVVSFREPGGEKVSEKIRKILLDSKSSIDPQTELLLYIASRAQLTLQKIIPALKIGKIVVCDRFFDSTLAYQGYGRGIDLTLIETLNRFSTGNLKPDLTILIDIPIKVSLKRAGNKKKDRLEKEGIKFYQRVREGYLEIAKKAKGRVKIIEGQGGVEEIWGRVKEVGDRFLKIKNT